MSRNIFEETSPSEKQAEDLKSSCGLDFHNFTNLNRQYWNLPVEALYEESIFRGECSLSRMGPLVVNTGSHTARAAKDKFIVRNPESEKHVWWDNNRSLDPGKFKQIQKKMQEFAQGRDLFVQDCFAGADSDYRLKVRIITEYAWHSLFAKSMLIRPADKSELKE